MRLYKLALVLAAAVSPVYAQLVDDHTPIQSGAVNSPHVHGPRKDRGPLPGQAVGNIKIFESSNWSGYAVIGADFTEARGSWVVPSVDCSGARNSSASFWVGIDGWDNGTVEQTGTDSDCDGLRPTYYAWYEFYPKPGVTITSVPVKPGDKMSAAVDYNGAEFVVTITNQTTGASHSASSEVPGARRNSAEWIAEANGSYGLSDFGIAQFGEDSTEANGTNSATDSTTTGPIRRFGKRVQESIMVSDQNVLEAVPSRISPDGTSFTVTWLSK
jgi:hypothetical protein